jgi:hypothetical protein
MADGNVVCASCSVSHKLVSVSARPAFSRSNPPSVVQSDNQYWRFDSKEEYVLCISYLLVIVSTRWIHVTKVAIAVERESF